MHIRTTIGALTAALLLTLTACESTESTTSTKPGADAKASSPAEQDPTPAEESEDAAEPDTDTSDTGADVAETAELPNLVGMDLQAAQDEAQAAGFFGLDDQDASGQNRLQVLDRNWTVCSQDPAPGTHPTDALVTLYAVKDTENC